MKDIMSVFEIFLVVLVAVAAVLGYISGLVRQLGTIAALVLGIVACRLCGMEVVQMLCGAADAQECGPTTVVLGYAGLFLAVFLAVKLMAMLVRKVVHGLQLGFVDRLCGAVMRVAVWVFLLSLFMNVWASFEPPTRPEGVWAQRVEAFAPAVIGMAQEKGWAC